MNSVIVKMFLVISILSSFGVVDVCAQTLFNKEFEYHVIPSTPANHLSPGKILGLADNQGRIVSTQVLKGSLPEGIALFDDGTLAVKSEVQHKIQGKYQLKVEFINEQGESFTKKIKFEILEPAHTDIEASARIAIPKDKYEAGNIIAQFYDPNGSIKEAKLIRGSIPKGVMLAHNKNFIVADPDQLVKGEYFCLFYLIDQKGGSSVLSVSLPIGIENVNKNGSEYYSTINEKE